MVYSGYSTWSFSLYLPGSALADNKSGRKMLIDENDFKPPPNEKSPLLIQRQMVWNDRRPGRRAMEIDHVAGSPRPSIQ